MALKKYTPVTPGIRQRVIIDRSGLPDKTLAPKSLITSKKKVTGRNNTGRITVRHRGGAMKRKYRIIEFGRSKLDIEGKVTSVEFDPNRTANIALITYKDGTKTFILAPSGLEIGHTIIASKNEVPLEVGNATLIKNIPSGVYVHNVEMVPGQGGKLGRSAGMKIQVQGRTRKYVQVKLPSGEIRLVHENCMATIGTVSNEDHMHEVLGKAGVNRRLGRRPTVRGVAMHAQDHPHGGGEGRTGTGGPASDKWGNRIGKRTRNNKRTDKFIVKRRYKK
ncbi:MAG: 50S ribosomal protein L2 [Candidatus Dojkabacteria bacterium]|nr:MAG: 50S ribosomal protein L2 [Candidatus Dojkabacteria bacterium]